MNTGHAWPWLPDRTTQLYSASDIHGHLVCVRSCNPHDAYSYPHCTDEKTKAQRANSPRITPLINIRADVNPVSLWVRVTFRRKGLRWCLPKTPFLRVEIAPFLISELRSHRGHLPALVPSLLTPVPQAARTTSPPTIPQGATA